MRIGEIINAYLQDQQMSQRQFAKKCGMSSGYISMLVNNTNPRSDKPIVPSLTALIAISKGLGITLDELFSVADDIDVDISLVNNIPVAGKGNGRLKEFVELFMMLTPEQQVLVIAQIKGILSNQ